MFNHSSELAIRAAVYLAKQRPGKLSAVHEIADECAVSQTYLAKVVQKLVNAGLVRSFRGAGKGVELGRDPEEITLSALVHAVEPTATSESCVLGLGLCSGTHPCALHHKWLPISTEIHDVLKKTTLAELVNSVGENKSERLVS